MQYAQDNEMDAIDYDEIPYMVPTEDAAQATYTSIAYVRQNPWKTNTYTPFITLHSKKLHLPFAHGYSVTTENAPQQAKLGMELQIGDIVVCAYAQCALLVRITSEVKRGQIDPIYMILKPEEHYQNPAEYGSGIVGFTLKVPYEADRQNDLIDGISWALDNDSILEPFFGLYRDIEVIGEITDVRDWRKIVGMAASGRRTTHFRSRPRQQTIRSVTFGYTNGDDDYGPMG
jgi:hypothetical protein